MSLRAGDYRPRNAEHTVLYRVIDEHLAAFLEKARRHADAREIGRAERMPYDRAA